MPDQDTLHTLIRSLSKSEKRYFQLFVAREKGGENYLKLFRAMERQPSYDQSKLRILFRDEKFMRQLHVTKNYLRQLILKSLRNYHHDVSRDASLKDVLRNVEILYNKELYPQCQQELKRAERIATQYELHAGMVEVGNWQRKLAQTLEPHGYETFKRILRQQEKAIEALRKTNEHWQTAVHVTGGMYQQQQNVSVRNIKLKVRDHAQTLEDKVVHYNTQYLLHLRNQDAQGAEEVLIQLISLLEGHPERLAESPALYVSTINNLLSFYVFQKNFREALSLIQKAKEVYDRWKITAANRTLLKQILRTYNIELEIYRDTKTFVEGLDFIQSTEVFVKSHVQKIPREYLVSFWFQLANIHFMMKDFNRSQEWMNSMLNARFKGVRTDLYAHAHVLNLMLHLEQQNFMVLRYYVDSARRYLKKVNAWQPYHDILLKFFAKISRLPLLEYKPAFRELNLTLFPHGEPSPIPAEALGYVDYRSWIEGKSGA